MMQPSPGLNELGPKPGSRHNKPQSSNSLQSMRIMEGVIFGGTILNKMYLYI
jgi:hypothetical protein